MHANSLTEMYFAKRVIELVLLLHLIALEVAVISNYIYIMVRVALIMSIFIHIVEHY